MLINKPLIHTYIVCKQNGADKSDRYAAAYALAKQGLVDDIEPELLIKHRNTFLGIAKQYAPPPQDLPEGSICGVWIYGPTGTGKSHFARNKYPDAYSKMPGNKWWDGYNGEDTVLLDDFPKDDSKASYLGAFLKQWVDRYAFNAEIKGTVKTIRPKTIVVTSNWHPREIWSDVGIIEPLLRRFHITKRDKKIDTDLMPPPVEGEFKDDETHEQWVSRLQKRKAEQPLDLDFDILNTPTASTSSFAFNFIHKS